MQLQQQQRQIRHLFFPLQKNRYQNALFECRANRNVYTELYFAQTGQKVFEIKLE